MKPDYFYLVEYSRPVDEYWHIDMKTLAESEAIERYEQGLKEFGRFAWRITLVREIRNSKKSGSQDREAQR